MKICAIICEYNPFHNGHLYHIQTARALSGADAVVCVMSGNFVQRGEAAIAEKHLRAKHAVTAGADAVIELPVPFATANAELFAKGAVHIISAIPNVDTLCFGAETADATQFYKIAELCNNEPKSVSDSIKKQTQDGVSYAKARATAYQPYAQSDILSKPNNILGVEYTKALLAARSNVQILPILRLGGDYNDERLHPQFSSATAIRAAIKQGIETDNALPDFVKNDLTDFDNINLETLEKYAILFKSATQIAQVCDCTEGLENALKKAAENNLPLVESLTSARYTSSRIRRIALQNLLNIDETLIRECLRVPLYLRVLAVKKERKDLLSVLGNSSAPLLLRAHDENVLIGAAKECFEKERFAEKVYSLLQPKPQQEKNIFM